MVLVKGTFINTRRIRCKPIFNTTRNINAASEYNYFMNNYFNLNLIRNGPCL